MAKEEITDKNKVSNKGSSEITFRCQFCNRDIPIEEMRTINRFFPMLVVCRDCEKEIR